MAPRHWTALALAIACFTWLHVLTIPHMLEDEDSVNLALGVEEFNVARYAPHLDKTDGEVIVSVDLRRTPDERLRGVPYRDFGLRVKSVGIGPRPPD